LKIGEIRTDKLIPNLGKKLELGLEKNYKVSFPLDADWGYTFRIETQQCLFDVLVHEEENQNLIELIFKPTIIQRIFKIRPINTFGKLFQDIRQLIGN